MAIKTALSYIQIGKNLKRFQEKKFDIEEIPFQLINAIGGSETIVQRYREGKGTVVTFPGLLIKGLLAYKSTFTENMLSVLQDMKADEKIRKANPAILLVSDGDTVMGYDPAADESYENRLDHLYVDYSFFTPMWGISKYRGVEENPADVKAAEKMAKLHDEIRRENEFTNDTDLHDLNIFMTRLLFCFFAEDTGIFADSLFTESIRKYTQPDASDLSEYLNQAFRIMDTENRNANENHALSHFPYVNGGLFSKKIDIPKLGIRARKLMLECGSLDWKAINPDIFGSMIQAVVTPELRSGLGMHYTSVPNIMKLIGPLFLDEIEDAVSKIEHNFQQNKKMNDLGGLSSKDFEKHCKTTVKDCHSLLLRISKMKFFDPACGSGNFLIITYKNLRLIENRLLHLIQFATQSFTLDSMISVISISQFYGIELDDFACETAVLSLWLAEHQMNARFTNEFGVVINALPLKTNSNIHHGNACRVDWSEVCPHTEEEEVFIMGNPPYLGARLQEGSHKEDMEHVFKNIIKGFNNLDYIACWFYKLSIYIKDNYSKGAFVTTNSISQGEQVPLLWGILLKEIDIIFTNKNFKWENNAKNNAGVICSIIGLGPKKLKTKKQIIYNSKSQNVESITAYLTSGKCPIVMAHNNPLIMGYSICFGNMPNDGGYLLLNNSEKSQMITTDEGAREFIRPYYGSQEFIRGELKYCLWITDKDYVKAASIPCIAERIEQCRITRENSNRLATKVLASKPYSFGEVRNKDTAKIIIPSVSSERREYIPIGFLDKNAIISNAAFAIYNAPIWLFGILTSKMHMTWVATVGGRLEMRYRYSAQLCYNTFPFPIIFSKMKEEIESAANKVLDVRDYHCGKTLAELYDPDKMPQDLREAHHNLDLIVESCYQEKSFKNDEERLECLFKLYEKMTKKK